MSAGKNYLLFSNEKLNRRTNVVLAYNALRIAEVGQMTLIKK